MIANLFKFIYVGWFYYWMIMSQSIDPLCHGLDAMTKNLLDELPTIWVKTDHDLYELIAQIDGLDRVALDTEFIKRATYFPILALVQVNTGTAIYLVDAPNLDLTDFWQALAEIPQMIWYACGEDLGIFYLLAKCPALVNVIDVQLAVAYLTGQLQMGYAQATKTYLGVSLTKSESQSDWLVRPLSVEQESYAADDVRYLLALWDCLLKQLDDKQLTSFVIEDSQTYAKELYDVSCESASMVYLNFIDPSYNHEQITVLQAICEWRNELALAINLPPTFIISKQALREIILRLPTSIKELSTTTLNRGSLRRYGDEILAVIKTARALPVADRPPMPMPSYNAKNKPFKYELERLIEAYSQATHIPQALVLKNRWMNELLWAVVAEGEITSYALQGYRAAWINEQVLPLLQRYHKSIKMVMGLTQMTEQQNHENH